MRELPERLTEGAGRRALYDAKHTYAGLRFKLAAGAVLAVAALLGAILPQDADLAIRGSLAVASAVGGPLVLGALILLVYWVIAPIRQRDDAREFAAEELNRLDAEHARELKEARDALEARENEILARVTAVHNELLVIERYLSLGVNAPPLPTDQWNEHSLFLRADTTRTALWATIDEAYQAANFFNIGAADKVAPTSKGRAARTALVQAFPALQSSGRA